MRKYYQLAQNGRTADITIYGDITSYPFFEGDVSSYSLSKELENLDADSVNVYINSYGGEVAEGLAIYNALRRHKAKVTTYCDGFACSIASVIFMAGDERIMSDASLLMIHNAWTMVSGNAEELRKEAEDLEIITQASVNAYMSRVSITEDEVKNLMDKESWILPGDAVTWGFATLIENAMTGSKPAQSARQAVFRQITISADTDVERIVKGVLKGLENASQNGESEGDPISPEDGGHPAKSENEVRPNNIKNMLLGFFNIQNEEE